MKSRKLQVFILYAEYIVGVLVPLLGTTNVSNFISESAQIFMAADGSLYVVVDANDSKVRRYLLSDPVIDAVVVGQGGWGTGDSQLTYTRALFVDTSLNLYMARGSYYSVMLWLKNSSTGRKIADNGDFASNAYYGLAVDSNGNIYASDSDNNRVMKFAPYKINGTVFAGTDKAGNDTRSLYRPSGLYLDEMNSHLYVTDGNNHRIQRYTLGSSVEPTTVAGGKGAGLASNQLYYPRSICISKKTGALYIADGGNSRVQLWNTGATSDLTVAGTGALGNGVMDLKYPSGVALNLNETFLYVSDSGNKRIQRFPLV
jgi:sugar lactone lactonase YvrE